MHIGAQKIDSSSLKTFGIVIDGFQVFNKLNREWFFQKTFLLAKTRIKVALIMFFLIFSNINIQFTKKEFFSTTYTTAEALLTIKKVEFMDGKDFTKARLDKNVKTSVISESFLSLGLITIHPA